MNRNGYKAEIQEMVKLLSQSNIADNKEDKKVKVVSTAAKAKNPEEDDEHITSDKSTLTTAAGHIFSCIAIALI